MIERIARQWRRLLLGAALILAFMAIHFALHGLPDGADLPLNGNTIVAAILAALIAAGVAILAFGIFAPGSLPFVEVFCMTLIVSSPLTYATRALGLPGLADLVLFVVVLLVVERVLMGDWHPRVLVRDTRVYTTRFAVPLSPDAVWRRVVPLPEHADSYVRPATQFLSVPEGQDGDFILLSKRRWGLKDSVETVRVLENAQPGHFRYTARPSEGSALPDERVDIRLTPAADGGTEVELSVAFLDAPLLMRLRFWIGQDARDYALSVRNRLLGHRDGTIHGRQIAPT